MTRTAAMMKACKRSRRWRASPPALHRRVRQPTPEVFGAGAGDVDVVAGAALPVRTIDLVPVDAGLGDARTSAMSVPVASVSVVLGGRRILQTHIHTIPT